MISYCFQSRFPKGEKIDWPNQNLSIVRIPGRFPLTSDGYGAGFAVHSVPGLPLLLVWDDGGSQCDLQSIHCLYPLQQRFDQSIEARFQLSTFIMSVSSHLRDRLFVFKQAPGDNCILSTDWR